MFAVGDKVLCVDDSSMTGMLTAGLFYVVSSLVPGPDGDLYVAPWDAPQHRVFAFRSRFIVAPPCNAMVEEDCECPTEPPPATLYAFKVGDRVRFRCESSYEYTVSVDGAGLNGSQDMTHRCDGTWSWDDLELVTPVDAMGPFDGFEEDDCCPLPGLPPAAVNPKTAVGAAKPNLALVLDTACCAEAVAMMNGAEKYGAFNWRESTVPAMTYVAAMRRHLALWLNGEEGETDPKTGYYVTHLGAVRANAAILIDAADCGTLVDDRPPAAVGALKCAMTRNLKEKP